MRTTYETKRAVLMGGKSDGRALDVDERIDEILVGGERYELRYLRGDGVREFHLRRERRVSGSQEVRS
ncbi:MAG: hypothetical protein KDE27_19385 [Planctomycetes bacterium]|nr:hypothetical protein [Planctomycetota bacterium]